MSKNVIICFDGTGNEPTDAQQEHGVFGRIEDEGVTNVLKLHLLFGGDLLDGHHFDDQISLYYPGVGTYGGKFKRAFNSALAPENLDVERIMQGAGADLKRIHENGDQIFLFGFSRGAAIARRFAALLHDYLGPDARIRFIGVFDTVASIGKPNLHENDKPISDVLFENGTISGDICEALHLLAIDERRKAFQPTLMNKDERVREVWFAGAHSDVGGGSHRDGLADIALQYMLDEIDRRKLGLKTLAPTKIDFDNLLPDASEAIIDLDDIMIEPDPFGKSHQQQRTPLASRITLDTRQVRVNVDDSPSDHVPLVHYSAAERIYGDEDYRPKALKQLRHTLVQPDGAIRDEFAGMRHLREIERGGEAVGFRVRAIMLHNHTGMLLERGAAYVFEVPADQTWFDAEIECGPQGWTVENQNLSTAKRLVIKLREDNRRHPSANWFELIGSVGDGDQEVFRIFEHRSDETAYVAESTGELCVFANDLKRMYGNNHGRILANVRRIR